MISLTEPRRSAKPGSRLALEEEEVERRGGVLAAGDGEQRMCLAAMVGLVVEEVPESRRQRLGDVGRAGDRAIAERAGKVGVAETPSHRR